MRRLICSVLLLVLGASGAWAEESDIRAQLVPKRFTMLSAEIPARIDHLSLREGDHFKEGQLLVGLDCALQRAQADEARAALGAAEKTKSVNRRMVELNSGGVLEADLAAAEAAKAQAKLQSTQVVLGKCTINAPFSGRVVEQKVREHQYVQAGQPLLDPQSGERIRGRQNIQASRVAQPNAKRFTVRRILGAGAVWVTEFILTYDGRPSYAVSVMEFLDGRVARETQYFGEPFEPGPSRAHLVERMG